MLKMKRLKFVLMLPLAIACISAAQAESSLSARQVSIPFNNEPILATGYSGLFFSYDMSGNPARKIVCKLAHVYKGWLEFRDQGAIVESGVYGGMETVTLTSKGRTSDPQFHADNSGSVTIEDTKTVRMRIPVASCYYDVDNNH